MFGNSRTIAIRRLNIEICNGTFGATCEGAPILLGTTSNDSCVGVNMVRKSLTTSDDCYPVGRDVVGGDGVSCVTLKRVRGEDRVRGTKGAFCTCYNYVRNRNFSRANRGKVCFNAISGNETRVRFIPLYVHRFVRRGVSVSRMSNGTRLPRFVLRGVDRGCKRRDDG